MKGNIRIWLLDIHTCISNIFEYVGTDRNFYKFKSDLRTKRAVEREFEIIGEAMNRILKANPEFHIENSKKIISLRNIIAHGYDKVEDEIIWGVIINHLPKLLAEVELLLKDPSN